MSMTPPAGSTAAFDSSNTTKTPAQPTVGHTWIIIIGALVLLWILGIVFRRVRQ